MRKCPKCGFVTEGDEKYCPMCGTPLVELQEQGEKREVVAIKSEVPGVSEDVMAYKSKVSGTANGKKVNLGKQDVMAVRSKVAGGHIVEGNYVHQSIHINVMGEAYSYPRYEEFYLIYLDESGEERNLRVSNEIEIYRKDKSWDVVAWDGRGEVKLGVRDMGISRKRKRISIRIERGEFIVRDYGMTNGVYVNGHRIKGEAVVSPGDVISISTLTFRLERSPERISVKRNSMMFIGKELAKYIPRDILYMINGKYYLNASGLKPGEVIQAGEKKIVVEDSSARDSILITKQLISDSDYQLLRKKIEAELPTLPENLRNKISKLLAAYDKSDEDVKHLYISEILRLLEESG